MEAEGLEVHKSFHGVEDFYCLLLAGGNAQEFHAGRDIHGRPRSRMYFMVRTGQLSSGNVISN